jgi:hypothetical protein
VPGTRGREPRRIILCDVFVISLSQIQTFRPGEDARLGGF